MEGTFGGRRLSAGSMNLVGTESIRDPDFHVETNGAGLKGKRDNCTMG